MYDPKDLMSPMNPNSAPNVLAATEKVLADRRAAAARKDAEFIERMNKMNANGKSSGYGQSAVSLSRGYDRSVPGRGRQKMEFWTPSTVFGLFALVVPFLFLLFG